MECGISPSGQNLSLMNEPMDSRVKEVVRLLRILHGGLVGGAFFLLIVALLMVEAGGKSLAPVDPEFSRILLLLFLIITAISIPAGVVLFRRQMKAVDRSDVMRLLDAYKSAIVVRAALAEGAVFFGTIVYLLQRNYTALGIAFILLLYLISLYPVRSRLNRETGLDIG